MRRVKSFLVVIAMLGCGGDEITGPGGELVLTPPPAPLVGIVLAADTFVVPATNVNFMVQPYTTGGNLIDNIESGVGKLFIVSVRDISRPDIVCTGSLFQTNCASIVVFRGNGRVNVALESGRRNPHRTCPWPATTVGRTERLVRVEVHHIYAEIARPGNAEKCVHVCAIKVQLCTFGP